MDTRVYFVRHARPDFSVKDELRPLTKEGLEDSKKVTKALSNLNISTIYSSPYIRAMDTLKDFAEHQGLEITPINEFRERSVGDWVDDFKTYSQKQWDDFDYKLATGESLKEVQARNIDALNKVISKNFGRSIVIGTHGTALSTIINYYKPTFGYDGFWSIIDKMPYILCFNFDGLTLVSIEEIEI